MEIDNPVENSLKFQWNIYSKYFSNSIKMPMKYKWKLIGNPNENSFESS